MATAKSPTTKRPAAKAAATRSSARKSAPVSAKAPAKSSSRRPTARASVARKAPVKAAAKKPVRATKLDRAAPMKTSARNAKTADKAHRRSAARAERKELSHIDRVWELAERIGICMFITWDGERQRSRPLAAHIDRKAHAIDFLTDVDGHKDEQIARFPIVSLAFSDGQKNRYVAITGKAEISNDRARIKKLWNPWAKAWWDSAEDPKIRVIRVTPEDAELWDTPGRIASTVAMFSAVLTGKSPKLLDNARVAI